MKTRGYGCGIAILLIGLAGPAAAQRSLFDTPTPEAAPPAGQAPAAGPAATPKAKPKPRKASGPTPARTLTVNNASSSVLASLEVAGEGKSAKLAKPLGAKKKTTLKMPALKGCTVAVTAAFEGQPAGEPSELDICKEKTIRFTE